MVVAQLVERLVYDTSGPQFESSLQQYLYLTFIYCQLYWNDKNKEKEAGTGPIFQWKQIATHMSDLGR